MNPEDEQKVDELLQKLNLDKTQTQNLKDYLQKLSLQMCELLYSDLEDEE